MELAEKFQELSERLRKVGEEMDETIEVLKRVLEKSE
jgi:hypothetical protein